MQVDSPWQAIRQRPWRLLASAWPWRSLAYLLGGIAPSAAVAAGLVAVTASEADGQVMALVVVPVAVALLLSGPLVARYERWRLRLVEPGRAALDPRRRPEGAGRRALEVGYGVVSVLVLWLIDLAVVAVSLAAPGGIVLALLASRGTGVVTQAAMLGVGLLALPLAAYPVTAWAGARSALARVILAPPDAELDQRLVEVTRSRARLVDAFEVERRRIERDLHDGAQQRLVALTVALGLARLDLPAGSAAAEQVDAAHEQAKQALTELRELIRGVHPQVLTDRGLPAAIGDAAGRSPLPVDVDVVLQRRLPPQVEVAAYFAVCEALANVARHSQASRAAVRGWLAGGQLVLEVRDDGVGGADPAAGSGLAGLADRVAVVDGRLLLSSPAGGPTVVRVELPCGKTVPST
jgi:signal transduction histidine kinase